MKETRYFIAGMDCPVEETLIRNRLQGMNGVDGLQFDLMRRVLTVKHELTDEAPLSHALNAIGMEPQPYSEEHSSAKVHRTAIFSRAEILAATVSGITALAAEVVSWATNSDASPLVVALALVSIAVGGRTTLKKGIIALKTLTLNINFLMVLAAFGAICIGQFPEAAMVTFLFAVAEMIEAASLERARNALRSLMDLTPETASVLCESGHWHEEPVAEIEIGQQVRVRPGERIALDGFLREGSSTVNQAPITGESFPVEKGVGDKVFAGTINERGSFVFEVTEHAGHTALDRIIRTVQEAQGERAQTQRFVEKFSAVYTPAIVGIAALVAILPPLLFHAPLALWVYRALVMLVIACPCALVLSTPVTIVSGLAAAARQGILIKGGVFLETGHKLRVIALDKTGTLTHGKPVVTDFIALTDLYTESELRRLAASLDAPSEHPVAAAIVTSWGHLDLLSVADFRALPGRGVTGKLEGEFGETVYFVGNHRLTEDNGVCGLHVETVLERLERDGKTTVVLTDEQNALAIFGVADTVRGTTAEAIRDLHSLGVRTVMLTGDNALTAQAIADQIGMDDVRGGLLPEDKLTEIAELKAEHGFVGMVGDGINDAPALAKSSLGFAMGAVGTDTAIETADVALMQDDLRKLPVFLRLSRRTVTVLRQNLALALGIKAVFFALALAGKATLWMAVFADMGASLLVVANGLRLLRPVREKTLQRSQIAE